MVKSHIVTDLFVARRVGPVESKIGTLLATVQNDVVVVVRVEDLRIPQELKVEMRLVELEVVLSNIRQISDVIRVSADGFQVSKTLVRFVAEAHLATSAHDV